MSDIEFSVLEAQQNIHELIAQQHPLEQTLDAIADWVGSMMPGALVSIMQFHPATNTLSLTPATGFQIIFSGPCRLFRWQRTWALAVLQLLPNN